MKTVFEIRIKFLPAGRVRRHQRQCLQVPTVSRHILQQGQHHKKRNFQAELIALLKKHGINYLPKYVVS